MYVGSSNAYTYFFCLRKPHITTRTDIQISFKIGLRKRKTSRQLVGHAEKEYFSGLLACLVQVNIISYVRSRMCCFPNTAIYYIITVVPYPSS